MTEKVPADAIDAIDAIDAADAVDGVDPAPGRAATAP